MRGEAQATPIFHMVADMERDARAASPTSHDSPGSDEYEPKCIVAEGHSPDEGWKYLIEWVNYGFHE
jgi:hypothetical protein